jgi:hypothetical protein
VIALIVALILPTMRMSRAVGVDDEAGYQYDYYKEDAGRMAVSTSQFDWDIGLDEHVRVTGSAVIDSISGATPSGAPPQTQWPFAPYGYYYQQSFQSAYNSQYNQFVNQNQIYYDNGLITYSQLTNGAAMFAQQTAPTIATNTANASYSAQTNNPNYHNRSVPTTELHDKRIAWSVQVPVTFGPNLVTPSFSYSRESDYDSFAGALNYSLALNEKNTTVSTGLAFLDDRVRNDSYVYYNNKRTFNFFLGLVQLISPTAYVTVNGTVGTEYGYLNDPYRGVMPSSNFYQTDADSPALFPEQRPSHRNSEILYISWTQFMKAVNASYELSYRFYHDSYGIYANTAGITWNQKFGKHLIVSPMMRYYLQSAADFYYVQVPDYPNLPAFYSSDYRLSNFESFAFGLAITWRVQNHVSLNASYMRYIMTGLDGITSQTAYPSANTFTAGLSLYF